MESSKTSVRDQQFTVVEYDLTSSEEELEQDSSYIYCSAKLSPPRRENALVIESSDGEESAVEIISDVDDSNTHQESARSEEEQEIEQVEVEEKEEDEPEVVIRPRSSKRRRLSDAQSDEEAPAKTTAIEIVSDSDADQPGEHASSSAAARKPYSLQKKDLPPELARFLGDAKHFFTRPHSLERHGQHVANSTYTKAEERILCFLGHARRARPKKPLTPEVFNSVHLIEAYLDFLKVDRGLTNATISNHASSLLYPLKYYHRSNAPRFSDVPIIAQLRRTATVLQRQGDAERSSTREDLQALNKWLDWDEVLEARNLQRTRFQMARSRKERAREACDLLLLSLYCHIPPGRGQEIRTMQIVQEADLTEPFAAHNFKNRNVALVQKEGGITLHFQDYKTVRTAGKDRVSIEVDTELCRLFKEFIADFRPLLHPEQSSDYLFLNVHGEPYSGPSFTKRLQRLFDRLTGRQVSINVLRSSFLTWAYSQRECDDNMKDSLAAALRHSREQAQTTYDRRTANERKSAALELARRKAEEDAEPSPGPSNRPQQPEFGIGDFVGLVAEDSTLQKPSVFLGRVQAFLGDDQVCLLWYKNVGGGIYSLQVDSSQWLESRESLVPVEVLAAKGREHAFRLRTSLRTIHKAVLDSDTDSS